MAARYILVPIFGPSVYCRYRDWVLEDEIFGDRRAVHTLGPRGDRITKWCEGQYRKRLESDEGDMRWMKVVKRAEGEVGKIEEGKSEVERDGSRYGMAEDNSARGGGHTQEADSKKTEGNEGMVIATAT